MKKYKKNYLSEQDIIFKYLKKLHFNKTESFNFLNDGALLKSKKNKDLIVTNDAIVEGIDFFQFDSPESIAQKIVTYNLSDLSSMGADPYCYTLSLSLNSGIDNIWIDKFVKKLFLLQKKYNFFLIGGDISKASELNISANFYGYVKKNSILHRNTSNIGDSIWVTGNIGQSYIGLNVLKKKIILSNQLNKYFINKYLFPNHSTSGPKILRYANSCIDISDGFLGDLSKLLNKKMGIELNISNLPFSKNAQTLITKKIICIESLLNCGDDYELIFTSFPKNDKKIEKIATNNLIKITKVGRIIKGKGIHSNGLKIKLKNNSYQHFF